MPERHLTSPVLDCSNLVGVKLSFWRWLGVEQPAYDHAYVRVSNNGTTWATVWQNTAEVADNSWSQQSFNISAYADQQATVYVRFTMGTTDGSWQYCGWNLDDVRVVGYTCDQNALTITTTDVPDWTVGVPYSYQLEATGGSGAYTWSDKNGDLAGTGLGLSAGGLLSGTPVAAGPITFTAVVTDEQSTSNEKQLSLQISAAVAITTDTLPSTYPGQPYLYFLTASGGTGTLTWTDKYGDLDDTGIALMSTGELTGAALSAGPIVFTAEVSDQVGSVDEKQFTITVLALYVCGDADGNGVGPDIEDLVYLVNYMFAFGPPPPEMAAVDMDGNGSGPDIADLLTLVNYMFNQGPALNCP